MFSEGQELLTCVQRQMRKAVLITKFVLIILSKTYPTSANSPVKSYIIYKGKGKYCDTIGIKV